MDTRYPVSEPSISEDERRRIRDAMRRAVRAIEQRDATATMAHIARLTGCSQETVKSYLGARRRPRPDFVRILAERSGVPAVELFAAMGWLPAHEVVPSDPLRIAEQVAATSNALDRLVPHVRRALASLDTTAPAPVVAAQAVLAEIDGAARFDVRLSKVVSSGRYAVATNTFAEFLLRDGVAPLTDRAADELATRAGVAWRPNPRLRARHRRYWNTSLELRARTHRALRDLDTGQHTWQGEPGTTTWVDAAQTYPTHLLVQDPLGGAGWPAAATPWTPRTPDTLLLLGGRHGTAPAAAVLAEAIGWQFVPVRSDVEVTADGYVFSVGRDRVSGRVLAWSSVAAHIRRRYEEGNPWPAVVLVRPSAFLGRDDRPDKHALALLRETPARVIYARAPRAFLAWWAQRQVGTVAARDFDAVTWLAQRERALEQIERELGQRTAPAGARSRGSEPAHPRSGGATDGSIGGGPTRGRGRRGAGGLDDAVLAGRDPERRRWLAAGTGPARHASPLACAATSGTGAAAPHPPWGPAPDAALRSALPALPGGKGYGIGKPRVHAWVVRAWTGHYVDPGTTEATVRRGTGERVYQPIRWSHRTRERRGTGVWRWGAPRARR